MKKILIVEDDVDTLDMIEFVLRGNGYAVIRINREITLKEIAGINPDMVILDFLTPYGLGTDLCLSLKNSEPTKHIPVILYSASNNLKTLAKESGADGYIAKPFDINDLLDSVNRLIL